MIPHVKPILVWFFAKTHANVGIPWESKKEWSLTLASTTGAIDDGIPLRKGTEILRNPDGLAYSSSNLSPIEYHFVARLVAQYLELSTKPLAILFVLLPLHSFDMGDQEVIARNNDHLVRSD